MIIMEWISVKDELPEYDTRVLVYRGTADSDWGPRIQTGELYSGDGEWNTDSWVQDRNVTHWMPLPTDPRLEETDE